MSNDTVITQAGLADKPRKSRMPARLDLAQSLTGLFLAVFMWGHMFFVATILLGREAMDSVSKFFELGYFFEKSHPGFVSIIVAIVAIIIVVHAALALRKFPINWKQFQTYRAHAKMMHHKDTTLWMWQVYTGFAMFFLASAHLYQMMVFPSFINAEASGARMLQLLPFYIVLLIAVELHGSIGLYRLAVKWLKLSVTRQFLKKCETGLMVFFLALGFFTMAAYVKIGYDYVQVNGDFFSPTYSVTGSSVEHLGENK
jgi:fumarate reductase subunit C